MASRSAFGSCPAYDRHTWVIAIAFGRGGDQDERAAICRDQVACPGALDALPQVLIVGRTSGDDDRIAARDGRAVDRLGIGDAGAMRGDRRTGNAGEQGAVQASGSC